MAARKGRGQTKTTSDNTRLYFYTTDIKQLAKKLREENAKAAKKFSMRRGYGTSPDEPALLEA